MKKNISMPQPALIQNIKNYTVVPLRVPNTLKTSPCSPRNHSKTKIRLVSPLNKTTQSVFVSKVNQPTTTSPVPQLHLGSERPNFIELGGRSLSKNKENTVMSPRGFQKMSNTVVIRVTPQPQPVMRDQSMVLPHPTRATYVQRVVRNVSPCRITFNNQLPKSVHQSIPTFNTHTHTHLHQRQGSNLTSHIEDKTTRSVNISGIVETKQGIPTQLVIRQENNIEELKENYKTQLAQIKKLREQINNNNLQIKKLLKSSSSLKEKVMQQQHSQSNQTAKQQKNLNQSCSSLVFHKQSQQQLVKPPCSKKTLIQGLYFQTNNLFEDSQQKIKNKQQVYAQTDVVLKECSKESLQSSKHMKLSLTKIEECQVVFMPPIKQKSEQELPLESSIVYQNQNNEQSNNTNIKQPLPKQEQNIMVYHMSEIQHNSSLSSIFPKYSNTVTANYTPLLNKQQIKAIAKIEYQQEISKKTIDNTPKRQATKVAVEIKQNEESQNLLPVSQVILKDQQQIITTTNLNNTKTQIQEQPIIQKTQPANKTVETQKIQSPQPTKVTQNEEKKNNSRRISNRMYL